MTVTVRSEAPVENVELLVALPAGLVAVDGGAQSRCFGLRTGEREQTLRVRCDRWGGYVLGDVYLRARDRFGVFRFEGRWEQRAAAQGLSARGDARGRAPAARDAGVRRQRGRAPESARESSSPTCGRSVRRSHAPHQLARKRASRRALGQRAPHRAEHRRRALPRHVRRGAAPGCVDTGRRRARGGLAVVRVPAPARPGRPRELRRPAALVPARRRG